MYNTTTAVSVTLFHTTAKQLDKTVSIYNLNTVKQFFQFNQKRSLEFAYHVKINQIQLAATKETISLWELNIHLSTAIRLQLGCRGTSPSRDTQTCLTPAAYSSSSGGFQITQGVFWWDMSGIHYLGGTKEAPQSDDWFLSMWRSSISILRPQLTEFLTPSLISLFHQYLLGSARHGFQGFPSDDRTWYLATREMPTQKQHRGAESTKSHRPSSRYNIALTSTFVHVTYKR